ncbi:hypothetical protein PAL_GLEAN10008031 [Pteropus alecto]|uniref:Stimulated by retinoic acid gene 6 protein-like n=1 Tax=Pteropus alecto TaxID=9402 RepID=L5KNT9_PTEAL|nr:hypothetical protein PAL_GLEAN10008031 [Pteropus alecto]
MELFLHYSLIPSLFIILILSFLQRREHRRQRDDTSYLLANDLGIIIPLDFVSTFSNRWSYGIAFGATANKVMFLFSEGYRPLQIPQWAQAFVLLIGGIEVGLSHFPFFACLSSEFRLVSSVLGFSYSLVWFAITILHITQCPHGQFWGKYEAVIFYWPSLLCLSFLLGRFLHMFVKSLRVHLGWELQTEEKPFLEVHQAEHVKQLLRKPPLQEKKKSWFETRIYEWDPCFQFPSRMIGTTVLAFICLYLFIIIEFCIFMYVRDELNVLEGELESYITSKNQTGTLAPVILRVKELMNVTKGYLIIHVVQTLCGVAIMYSLVLPIIHNRMEMLQGLGIGILTISIVLGLMILQVWVAASLFLQPKMGTADKQKPLALNNRKVFHNFSYFLFFYNVLLGLSACLSRLLTSCILGTWLIARIDRTIMQSGYERADMGFRAWIGMLFVDHYHTNPVLVSFCHILITGHRERSLQQAIKYGYLNQSPGTPEALCPCPSNWTPPLFPEMSSNSAESSISQFLRLDAYPRLQARCPPRWCSVVRTAALLAANSWLYTVYSHPSHHYYSALLSAGKPPVSHVLSAPIWTVFTIIPNTTDNTQLCGTNTHPSSHFHVPRSSGVASSPTFIPRFTLPGQFFLQPLRRTERIALFPQSSCSDSILGHRISARSRTRWLLLQTLINNPRLVMLRKSKPSRGSREFTQPLLTCSES